MGQIVELQAGAARARLVPAAGGRVSALWLERPGGGSSEVLHPYPEDFFDPLRWGKGGIYPLAPYSNRIADAQVQVGEAHVALQAHPDAAPHTLHGNAHAQPWQLEHASVDTATLVLHSPAAPAWPWRYTARMVLQLAPHSLSIRITLTNTDSRVMPAGLGLHPYFRHAPAAVLGYRAKTFWEATPEFLATHARAPSAAEQHDPARPLPEGGLTWYVGAWDGEALLDLPDGARLRIVADETLSHLVVHRPDNLAYLCLEPVSHVANGFNLAAQGVAGTGTRLLAPGESLEALVRFELMKETT